MSNTFLPPSYTKKLMEDRAAKRREVIGAMPRLHFVCGHDWMLSDDTFFVGFFWHKNQNASECENIYQRWFLLRWRFSMRLDRR